MIGSSERRRVARFAVVVALVGASSAAAATPSHGAHDSDLQTARALYREGVGLRQEGRLDEARARIAAAYHTAKTPVLALELGSIEIQLGHLLVAYEVLREVEALPPSPRESAKGRDARREAAALAASLHERLAKVRWMRPNVGIDVRLDGENVDPSEQERRVEPGAHVATLHLEGRACATERFEVREGETRILDLRAAASQCKPPAPREAAVVPPPLAPVPEAKGLGTTRWIGIGLVGAGAVATAAGVYIGVRARGDYDAVADRCPEAGCTRDAYDLRQDARARASAGGYAIGLGAAAMASGALLWILAPGEADEAKPVRVGVSGTGVWMSVRIP